MRHILYHHMAAGILDRPLDHQEVQETADRVKDHFERLVTSFVAAWRKSCLLKQGLTNSAVGPMIITNTNSNCGWRESRDYKEMAEELLKMRSEWSHVAANEELARLTKGECLS